MEELRLIISLPPCTPTVPPNPSRLPRQQGWKTPSLHPIHEGRPDRSQSYGPDPTHLQALRRTHGAAPAQALHPIHDLLRETAQGHQEPSGAVFTSELPKGHVELGGASGEHEGVRRRV